jgi:hypothetical protein
MFIEPIGGKISYSILEDYVASAVRKNTPYYYQCIIENTKSLSQYYLSIDNDTA